jgi:hypothetical protein
MNPINPQEAQALNLANAIKAATTAAANQALDVVFATPTYDHRYSQRTYGSMIETESLLSSHGIKAWFVCREGDPFVAKVRNKLVTDFLRDYPNVQNFFFIDDDVGWTGQANKVLEFLKRPEDVVVGIYPKKSKEIDFPLTLLLDLDTGELVQNNGLYGALMVPTGFMRIKRHVLEKLAANSRMFTDAEVADKIGEYYYIFETGPAATGEWWGEDYVFCRKWIDMGGSIWVDPEITFSHQGHYTWHGRLSEHLDIYREKAVKLVKVRKEEAEQSELSQQEAAE